MAASLRRIPSLFASLENHLMIRATHLPASRNYHLPVEKNDSDRRIVMADNGGTIVCWHPETKLVVYLV